MNDEISTKQRILEAAAVLFGERGFDGASASDIAAKANVNKALIFYHYGSKDALYRAVFKHWLDEFRKTMDSSLAGAEPGLGMIETFVRTHIDFLRRHEHMLKVLIRELLRKDIGESPLIRDGAEVIKPLRNNILVAIATARKRGEIRDVDPIQTLVNIISLDIFFFLGKSILYLVNPSVDQREFAEKREDYVLDLLINGLRKRPE